MRARQKRSWLLPWVVLFASTTIALCSCRDHASAISSEQAAPSASALALDASSLDLAASADASDASDTSLGAAFDAGPLKAPVKIASADKWLINRGASVPPYSSSYEVRDCEEIVVGTAREAALLCTDVKDASRGGLGSTGDYVYRVIDHRTVRVVRAGKTVTVLDAEITLEPLDREMGQKGNLLDLRFRLAPDGMSATIDEHIAGTHCPSAKYLSGQSCKTGDAFTRFDCEQWSRMCNARGGYVWQGDRFVRDPSWIDPTPPATKAAAAPTSTEGLHPLGF